MEQLNRQEYDCCNYCKYFQPMGENSGVCSNSLLGKLQTSHVFYYSHCIVGCFHTIHNHYNVDSPEYIQEYKKALSVRRRLRTDIYYYRNNYYPMSILDNRW